MKKVLVAYTNYDYLKYVKAWVRGARDVGKWDDDIVIIIPLEDKVKVHNAKLYISYKEDATKRSAEEIDHGYRMERWRTTERNLPSELSRDVYENKKSFQGCLLLFNKKIIEDGYFEKLKETHFKYAVYYGCCETFRDQTILNLVFDGKWDDLGDEYVNKIPIIEELNWDVEKLQEGYYDDYDYTGKSIIHFLRYFAPWDENNLRFYPIWKEHNDN